MPAFNGAAAIALQLEALTRQSYTGRWELIVADNGSTDETVAVAESWAARFPRFRLIQARERRGTSHARNAGCRVSGGDIVLCCDHDDIVSPDWIVEMTSALRQYDAVGGSMERRSLNDPVALAARPPKLVDELLNTFEFLPYPLCANCGFRKELWKRLGGFDESYRYGSDDVEFFWRAQLAGATLGFVPRAVVHYRLRSDVKSIARQSYGYGRSHPKLFRQFRAVGMPRSNLRQVIGEWRWLAVNARDIAGPKTKQAVWFKRAGQRWGRIVGSIRNWTVYL
jgi:GT2 family glycosyltransferase